MRRWQRQQQRLLFTQVGYPSCANCGEKGALRKYPTVNEQCQVEAYTGILDVLLSSKYSHLVAGLYFWNWLPCVKASGGSGSSSGCAIGPSDNAESPQGKAAEATVRSYYTNHTRRLSHSHSAAATAGNKH